MATIKDILNKYSAASVTDSAPGIAVSQSGATQRNLSQEFAAAQKFGALQTEASASAVDSQLLEQQRKQASMQRDDQIISLKRQGQQERERYAQTSDKIINDLQNSRDRLSTAEQMDKMEAAAANLRLQDDKYRYELADMGRRQRLDDAVSFDDALKQAVFSEEWKLFQNNLAYKRMLDLDEAAFQKELSKISIEDALAMANASASAASSVAAWSAGGSAAVTAFDAYRSYKPTAPGPKPEEDVVDVVEDSGPTGSGGMMTPVRNL
jgi:hypothetical protein